MVSAKAAIEALLEDATYGIKVYDDAGAAGSGTFTSVTGTQPPGISPLTLVHGANTPTITTFGTFKVTLPAGSVATVASDGWVVTASPVSCIAGDTTITVEAGGAGTITITVSTVPILLAGHVLDHWPGDRDFATYAYVIVIGPVIAADAQIQDLGSFNKIIWEYVQLSVHVREKRGKSYAAEKTRSDLVQDVDRCLHHFSTSPGTGYKHVNASAWREVDSPGERISAMTVEMLYEKARV